MNEPIYDDGAITVTPAEVRAKGFVLYMDSVSSISVNTVRPGKWVGPLMAVPAVSLLAFVLFINRLFKPFLGQQPNALSILPFIAILPFCIIAGLAFLFRISRLSLQTTGGPVLLASKISLTDPYETVLRYEQIKNSIEKAISRRKK
jgi:hypothetical protein